MVDILRGEIGIWEDLVGERMERSKRLVGFLFAEVLSFGGCELS